MDIYLRDMFKPWFGEKIQTETKNKNIMDNYYKTSYGSVRSECSSCRIFKLALSISADGFHEFPLKIES